MTPDNVREFAGLRIQDKNDVIVPGLCMAIYGVGGSGKTSLLADIVSSKHGTPALLLDAEGGSSSVTHLRDLGLDIVHIKSWADVEKVRRALKSNTHYKSVIWDNVSEILRLCMKGITTLEIPQIQHYGQLTSRMMDFIAEQRDMSRFDGTNVGLILWEETERDDLTGMIRNKLNLTPKFGAAVPGMVTMVGRLTVVGKKPPYVRKLSFVPSTTTDAKFRVSPTEAAAKIPQELWLKEDSHLLVDFLATVRDGTTFPVTRYAEPLIERAATTSR